ncbi:P-loop NTPase [candidate division KSB1 bacterium]|nr:P-loop NTPase [candidate division KSB1 bacterium]
MMNEQDATVLSSVASDGVFLPDFCEETGKPRVITVGGGKGGVGKTMFTVLLGLSLVKVNKRAVIVDADFRSPSMNSMLRVKTPQHSLKDFLSRQVADINAILQLTSFKNLRLISGATGILGMTEYCFSQCSHLISNLRSIDADFILIDLESGTSREAIDLFLTADERIIIANPNPMSLQENYAFLKLCQFKKLRDIFRRDPHMFSLIRRTFESNNSEDYQELKYELYEYSRLHSEISLDFLQPRLVLNMMRKPEEIMEIRAFQMVCRDLLDITLEYWGNIHYQDHMRTFVRSGDLQKLLSAKTIHTITQRLVNDVKIDGVLKRSDLKKQTINYFDRDDITCSSHCSHWNKCIYQRGGYPCKLKYMGFLCTSGETT